MKEVMMRKKLMETLIAIVAILALMVTISESEYFPWSNLAGLTVIAVIAFVAEHREEVARWKRSRNTQTIRPALKATTR
jgi:cell shape-determining protein MreC